MLYVGILLSLGQSAVAIQTTVRILHDLLFPQPTILMREGLQIITIYTFDVIWWRRGSRDEDTGLQLSTAGILVGTLWLFLTVFFIASLASAHSTPPFYYPTPVLHFSR